MAAAHVQAPLQDADESPVAEPYTPAGQSTGAAVDPVQYEPGGQTVHPAGPFDFAPAAQYCPALQLHDTGAAVVPVHANPTGHVTPAAAVLPAGQYEPAAAVHAPAQIDVLYPVPLP